ncbi:MAG: DUF5069 domain-containing protein [Verrucomicrobiota bacterium]
MTHSQDIHWTADFRKVYDAAVAKYRAGKRGADTFFSADQMRVLDAIGYSAQELYDFAEDAVNYGEPSYETAEAVAAVRREYFLQVQNGRRSRKVVPMEALPPKSEAVDGIGWLPRLVPKAMAKLQGEMNPDLMYGCGGDRKFMKEHGLKLENFLRKAWECDGDTAALVAYVQEHSPALAKS